MSQLDVETAGAPDSFTLHPNISKPNSKVLSAKGINMYLENGQVILDATGGPAVACIGHGDSRIRDVVAKQMDRFSFCHSLYWANDSAEMLASELVRSTDYRLAKAIIYGSGSEAVEAAMKLARQHFINLSQPTRSYFIARFGSFHGTTLGALALTEQANKRREFGPLLPNNVAFVSSCHPYRGRRDRETVEDYVARLANELDEAFGYLGEEKVCAFIAETVSGSSLGCVPPVPSYFRAMKAVYDKHGALLILDEVLCGMGRTGTVHAWQQEGAIPDIEVVAKGLAGGYAIISALLMHQHLLNAMHVGTNFFNHGHTYQAHPVTCAAALEVQRIVRSEDLIHNVAGMGRLLGEGLKYNLDNHPYVGDIRDRGLLWAIEFVRDKASKDPFHSEDRIAISIRQLGLQAGHSISLQPGGGSVDGVRGDHILLAPPYNVTEREIQQIIAKTTGVILDFFEIYGRHVKD